MTYGCHNREPFKETLKVQDGWTKAYTSMLPQIVELPFRMTTECQYRKTAIGKADPGCVGCKWREE